MKELGTLIRRNFLQLLSVVPDSILLAIGGISYGFLGELNWFKVETVKLKLKRLPRVFSGLRVAQISDIHMGGWMNLNRFQRVAELINRLYRK
jgi:predicted MPP superfamily phosphohydrolase